MTYMYTTLFSHHFLPLKVRVQKPVSFVPTVHCTLYTRPLYVYSMYRCTLVHIPVEMYFTMCTPYS